MDPFIVECQVYDYLIESKLVGVVGPYCHGWLVIDKALERDLEQLKLWKSLEEDPIHGLLLEYVEGCTIDKGSITAIAAQSLRDQLDHLHNMDIAHGDLCPRNIMVSSDGRAFLLDFSSAKLWPHSSSTIRGKDDFLAYNQGEKRVLELILFRLQKLKTTPRHNIELLPRVRKKPMDSPLAIGRMEITPFSSEKISAASIKMDPTYRVVFENDLQQQYLSFSQNT